MKDTQLKDYVKVYKNFLSKDYCAETIFSFDQIKCDENYSFWKKHEFYVPTTKNIKSFDTDFDVSIENFSNKKDLTEKLWNIIHQYIVKDMGHMSEWFSSWSGYTLPRLNKYTPKTEMHIHCDHIHTMFDGQRRGIPILSIVGALNDDYEGGEFLMWGEPIDLKGGDVMVFPSNFLYPHSVSPVVSGTRYSYVSWVW